MKVLMVHDHSAIIGGAEVQVQREIDGLRDLGHDVRLVAGGCGQGAAASLASDYGFRIGGSFVRRNLRIVHNPGAAKVLRQAMSEFQPDVVHCHTFTTACPCNSAQRCARRPCRHSPRLFGHVPAAYGLPFFSESQICGIGDFACCRRHVGVRYGFELARTTWAQRTLRRFDAIIAPSTAVAEAASAQGLERIGVVNGCVAGLPPPCLWSEASKSRHIRRPSRAPKGVETLLTEFALLLQEVPSARLQSMSSATAAFASVSKSGGRDRGVRRTSRKC